MFTQKDADSLLPGAKGIVYLMFLGRNKRTSEVAKLLEERKIVKDRDSVYGCVNRLQKDDVIRIIEVGEGPGPPKIKTADPKCIRNSIKKYMFWTEPPRYAPWEEIWNKFEILLSNLTMVMDDFPKFLSIVSEINKDRVADLEWRDTLNIFLHFCDRFLRVCWNIRMRGRPTSFPHYDSELRKISLESRLKGRSADEKLAISKINEINHLIMYEFINDSSLTDDQICTVGNLIEGPDDVFKEGSFLQRISYMILSLQMKPAFVSEIWLRQITSMAAMKRMLLNTIEGKYNHKPLSEIIKEYGDRNLIDLIRDAL